MDAKRQTDVSQADKRKASKARWGGLEMLKGTTGKYKQLKRDKDPEREKRERKVMKGKQKGEMGVKHFGFLRVEVGLGGLNRLKVRQLDEKSRRKT